MSVCLFVSFLAVPKRLKGRVHKLWILMCFERHLGWVHALHQIVIKALIRMFELHMRKNMEQETKVSTLRIARVNLSDNTF